MALTKISTAMWNSVPHHDTQDFNVDDAFYVDVSAGKIGIGTTSPASKLHVDFTSDNDGLRIQNSNRGHNYLLTTAQTNAEHFSIYDIDNNANLMQIGYSQARIYTNNTERMRIDSSGRVGINRIPAAGALSLEVMAPSSYSLGAGFHSPSTQSTIEFKDANTTASFKVRIGSETDDMLMFAGGSERMRITSEGNVGIGTTSPDSNLDVVGATGIYQRDNSGGSLVFDDTDIADASVPMSFIRNSAGSLSFGRANRNSSTGLTTGSTESVRITSAGNVGIGTTSPTAAKLDVAGAVNVTGGTIISGTDVNANVGVAINRGKGLYSNDGVYLRKIIEHTSGGDIAVGQGGTGLIGNITFQPGSSGDIKFYPSGGQDVTFASSGNVGIGTTSPSSTLEISKNDQTNGAVLSITNSFDGTSWTEGDTIGSIDFKITDASTAQKVRGQIKVFDDATPSGTFPAYNAMSFSTANLGVLSERMRLESDGDLHVEGDVIAASTTVSSDKKLKKDIKPIADALGIVHAIKGVDFTWKKNNKKSSGVIAQDIQSVMPHLVKEVKELGSEDSHLAVNYDGLIGVLIEAVKDLSKQVEELKK